MDNFELTLLTEGQIWGNDDEEQLDAINKYGINAAASDLCILTGGCASSGLISDSSLYDIYRRRTEYWTKTEVYNQVRIVNCWGNDDTDYLTRRRHAIRPVIKNDEIFDNLFQKRVEGFNGIYEVEFGEYPQYAVYWGMQLELELELSKGLNMTDRKYTFDFRRIYEDNEGFDGITYCEYEYQGRRFIRVSCKNLSRYKTTLSNGIEYERGNGYVWIEVLPVKWLIDEKTKTLISKIGLLSGIRFNDKIANYHGDFDSTEIKKFMDNIMLRDMFQPKILEREQSNGDRQSTDCGKRKSLSLN